MSVMADGHGALCRGQCPLTLAHLLGAPDVGFSADTALLSDVPAVPVGGNGREFAQPARPRARGTWRGPETLYPTLPGPDGLDCQCTGTLFHGLVALAQCLGHLGVADTLCPGDEPGDQGVGSPPPATGGFGPTLHAPVQHSAHIGGVGQGPAGHQARESGLNVEAPGFRVAESGQERTVGRTGSQGLEVCVAQT